MKILEPGDVFLGELAFLFWLLATYHSQSMADQATARNTVQMFFSQTFNYRAEQDWVGSLFPVSLLTLQSYLGTQTIDFRNLQFGEEKDSRPSDVPQSVATTRDERVPASSPKPRERMDSSHAINSLQSPTIPVSCHD